MALDTMIVFAVVFLIAVGRKARRRSNENGTRREQRVEPEPLSQAWIDGDQTSGGSTSELKGPEAIARVQEGVYTGKVINVLSRGRLYRCEEIALSGKLFTRVFPINRNGEAVGRVSEEKGDLAEITRRLA